MDGDVSPYIEEKKVILCRSGMQVYSRQDVINNGMDIPDDITKDTFIEYRPPSVVIRAKSLYSQLPVTKEHPSEWVTPDNWNLLTGGISGKEVDVVALDDDNIGLESTLTFYSKSLHDYYLSGNKEVSCGYKLHREWVDNPEEKGYDLILKEIKVVNHLAITARGRGGADVSIFDSIVGGMKKMRTGLFFFAKNKGKQNDSTFSFSGTVYKALDSLKGAETDEDKEKIVSSVFDSISNTMDSDKKTQLMNMVRDALDDPKAAKADKDTICPVLDSCYNAIAIDSMNDVLDATKSPDKKDDKEGKTEDADMEKKKEDEKDKKKDKTEDGCSGNKKSETASKDSLINPEEIASKIVESLKNSKSFDSLIESKIKDSLGVKSDGSTTSSKDSIDDAEVDFSNNSLAEAFSDALRG